MTITRITSKEYKDGKIYEVVQDWETLIKDGEKNDYFIKEISRTLLVDKIEEFESHTLLEKIKDLESRIKKVEEIR